jgi:hypothetical protein
MDPVTIFAILGGILAGGSVASELNKQDKDGGPVIVRTVWTSGPNDAEQWRATELLSEEALKDTGRLFDLDMEAWWPMVESNTVRVVVLAELSGRKDRHVVFRAIKVAGGWTLDVAYGTSGAKVQKHQLQRINAVLKNMSWIQSRVDYPMDPIAQPLYNIGGPNAIWILDRYLIEKTSELLQMSLDDYMQHYAMAGDRTAYAYAIADTSSGMPKVAFVLQVVDGEYSLDEARGIHNRVPTEVEQDLIETFIDDLNEQGAVEGVLPGHVPGLPAAVPESRQLEVDELEGVYDIPEGEREYVEVDEVEEDDMSMMPEPDLDEDLDEDLEDDEDIVEGADELETYLLNSKSIDSGDYSIYPVGEELAPLVGHALENSLNAQYVQVHRDQGSDVFILVEWVDADKFGYFSFDLDDEDGESSKRPRIIAAFYRTPEGQIYAYGPRNEAVDEADPYYETIEAFYARLDNTRDNPGLIVDDENEELEEEEEEGLIDAALGLFDGIFDGDDEDDEDLDEDLDDEDDDSEDLDDYDESLYDEAAIEDALEGQTENLLEGGSFLDAGDELEWDEVEAEDMEIDSDDELDDEDELGLHE